MIIIINGSKISVHLFITAPLRVERSPNLFYSKVQDVYIYIYIYIYIYTNVTRKVLLYIIQK